MKTDIFHFINELTNSCRNQSQLYHYGFVMFRQRKEAALARGYFQKSVVLITTTPFVSLYEKVIRVVGPLVFQVGASVLPAVYKDMEQWPVPVEGTSCRLDLAGTCIKYVVPRTAKFTVANSRDLSSRHSFDDSPSLTDIFQALQYDNECMPQSVGLCSTFLGFEMCLWHMWQLAVLGESLLVATTSARICSQIVLAFIR